MKNYVIAQITPQTILLMLVLAVVTSGCSFNRFIAYQVEQKKLLSLDFNNLELPKWSTLKTNELYNYCLQQNSKNLNSIVLLLNCAAKLLNRNDVTTRQKEYALKKYNSALELIINPLLNTNSDVYVNLIVNFDIEFDRQHRVFLTSNLTSLNQRLKYNIYGEIGVLGIIARRNERKGLDLYYPLEGIFRSIVFTLDNFQYIDGKWVLNVKSHSIIKSEEIKLSNQSYWLKYSPAAAYLMLLEHANIDDLSLIGLVNPSKVEDRLGVFAVEEFNHTKIPVIMTHGLNSDPLIWRYLTTAILNDEKLHSKYQIWHTYFPTGPPPFYSAMMLRKQIQGLLKKSPELSTQNKGVFIGHSLGGIVVKTMVTNSGYKLWDRTFKERPEILLNTGADNKIEDIFIFTPVFSNNKVIFIDTPHSGSNMANSIIGQLGSAFVTLPKTFIDIFRTLLNKITPDKITKDMWPFLKNYGPNSVQVLRPGHPLIESLNTIKVQGDVFSIIGSKTKLQCISPQLCSDITDGVVPFLSAHNNQAKQEIIVHSNHNSYRSQEAINFILKILNK